MTIPLVYPLRQGLALAAHVACMAVDRMPGDTVSITVGGKVVAWVNGAGEFNVLPRHEMPEAP